ncbi:MAG: PAS domain S-box protein [Chloroflexota bacterium]
MDDKTPHILIVDDDEPIGMVLARMCQYLGYQTETVQTCREALKMVREHRWDAVLLDHLLPDGQGIDLIPSLHEIDPNLGVIITTGYASIEIVMQALNAGAAAFITKPVYPNQVKTTLTQVLDKQRLLRENKRLYEAIGQELVERKRTEEQLNQQAAQLMLLNQISGQIATKLELESVLNSAAQLIQVSFGYHHVALFTLERAQKELVMRARAGDFSELFPPDHRLALGQGMVGWVAEHGQGLLANDVSLEPRHFNPFPKLLPTRSELTLPIQIGEEVVGVLDIQSPQLDAFDENNILVLETLVDQIAGYIENARLYTTLQVELTERKQAEVALKKSEERFRSLVEGVPVGIYRVSPEGQLLEANPALMRLLDYPNREALMPVNLADHYLDQAAYRQWQALIRQHGEIHNFEAQWRRHNGAAIWIQDSARTVRDEQGHILYCEGVIRDITTRKQVEEVWKKHEFIIDSSLGFLTIIDQNHVYEAVNASYCQAHNKSREAIVGRKVADIWGAEKYRKYIKKHLDDCFAGKEVHYQGWFEFAALGLRYLDVTYYPYFDSTGRVSEVMVVSRDLTTDKRAEEIIKEERDRARQYLEAAGVMLLVVGADQKVNLINHKGCQILGYSEEEVVGQNWFQTFMPARVRTEAQATFARLMAGENEQLKHGEYPILNKQGQERIIAWHHTVLSNEADKIAAILSSGEDMTERRVLEMQLAQAQKLEAIGQLTAGIAHEINTPTQYIGDNVSFLQGAFDKIGAVLDKYERLLAAARTAGCAPELVADIENTMQATRLAYLKEEIPLAVEDGLEGVRRVTKIVQAMRIFSHPGVEEKTAVNINEAIESTITVARNEWKYVADLETDFDPDLPAILCLPGELNQAILNILINAAHAIADVVGDGSTDKGKITVKTRRSGDWAEIRISDTGTGIPEAVQHRIFDPFFTTKEVGKGTGQGLAITHSVIVEKHGGTISFQTGPNKGTTFIIHLPITIDPGGTGDA